MENKLKPKYNAYKTFIVICKHYSMAYFVQDKGRI